MRCPSGLNATLDTAFGVAGERLADGLAGVGVPQPQRLVATAGDDAVPVGAERHAGHRVGVAGERLADRLWPVSASHSRSVLSRLPETMRCPSGLNATLYTASVWPVSGWPMGWPVSASHSRTRLVATAGDDAVPVGAERHAPHLVRVAGERLADGLTGVGVPQPHGLVFIGGDDAVPVGAERQREYSR